MALLVAIAVLLTATLSGVFGMAGGMLLMAVFAAALPIGGAMMLHGATQLAANGYRAWLFRRHIWWPAIGWYGLGCAVAAGGFALLSVTADRAVVLIALGIIPIAVALAPTPAWLTIESRAVAVVCGALVTAAQLIAGASGPVLDAFYVKSRLDRFQIIGTKGLTQAAGHAIKISYYAALLGTAGVPLWWYALAIACALIGTRAGQMILARMSDRGFRRWSGRLILAIAVACLARGACEWASADRSDDQRFEQLLPSATATGRRRSGLD